MTELLLAHDVYFCPIDDNAVLLDLRSGKYLAIDHATLPHLMNRLRGSDLYSRALKTSDDGNAEKAIRQLLERHLLTLSTEHGKPYVQPPVLTQRTYHPVTGERSLTFTASDFASILVAAITTRRWLKSSRLKAAIDYIQARKAVLRREHREVTSPPGDLIAKFVRMRTWLYSAHNHCLFDSLALTLFLLSNRFPATLVLGIKTNPFAAHAWVDAGGAVLNDEVETVQGYTPIMAV